MNLFFAMLSFADREKGAEAIRYLHPHVDDCTAHLLDGLIRDHRSALDQGFVPDVFEAVELMLGHRILGNPRAEFLRLLKEHVEAAAQAEAVDTKWLATLAQRFVDLEPVTATIGWMKHEYAAKTLLLSRKKHHVERALELADDSVILVGKLPDVESREAASRIWELQALAQLRLGKNDEALDAWRAAATEAFQWYRALRMSNAGEESLLHAAARILRFRQTFHDQEGLRGFQENECGVTAGLKAELVAAHPSLADPPC